MDWLAGVLVVSMLFPTARRVLRATGAVAAKLCLLVMSVTIGALSAML